MLSKVVVSKVKYGDWVVRSLGIQTLYLKMLHVYSLINSVTETTQHDV